MFTIYIHILEVLAQNPNGASVKMIVDMSGSLIPTDRQALSYLRDLKAQKLVEQHSDPSFWVMTERARDYCERVARCYDLSHPEEILEDVHYVIADGYVLSIDADGMLNHEYSGLASDDGSGPLDMSTPEKMPQEDPQDAISGVLSDPQATKLSETKNASILPHDDEYDDCAYCGKTFLARTAFDNFYCNACYLAGNHLPGEDEFPIPDDESFDPSDDFDTFNA